MNVAERKLYHTKAMTIWRSVLACHYLERQAADKPHLSDQQLIDKFRIPAPQTMVSLLRLNLFVRLIVKGSCSLKRSVFAARRPDKSWLKAVERDLALDGYTHDRVWAVRHH